MKELDLIKDYCPVCHSEHVERGETDFLICKDCGYEEVPDEDIQLCAYCGTETPSEFLENGLCPVCAEIETLTDED